MKKYVDFADKFIKTVAYPDAPVVFYCKTNGVLFSMYMAKMFCELHGVKATYDYVNRTVEFKKPLGVSSQGETTAS
jgi:hypothetical protein